MPVDTTWLKEISNPESNRDFVKAPVLYAGADGDGITRSAATDGRLLVMLDAAGPFEAVRLADAKILAGVLDAPAEYCVRTMSEDLLAWCGPYQPPRPVPCDECNGGGKCECPRCEAEHDCGWCNGGGIVTKEADDRPGVVAGVKVDQNKLAKALARLSGPCEVWTAVLGTGPMLDLRGRGWRVLLMGLSGSGNGYTVFGEEGD